MSLFGTLTSAAGRIDGMPPRAGHGRVRMRSEDTAHHGVKRDSQRMRRRHVDRALVEEGLWDWPEDADQS